MSQFFYNGRKRHQSFPKKPRRTKNAGSEIVAEILSHQGNNGSFLTETNDIDIATNSFQDFAISDSLKRNIAYKRYATPTPIQDQAIPAILNGKDVVGIANTGTGKTAAFLIPLIHKVLLNREEKVFIVTPTRELALQIHEDFNSLSYNLGIRSAVCFGGSNIQRQKLSLKQNPNFIIGTPGRIKDLICQHAINLSQFKTVVLDETDRMVDIGFITDIKYFIGLLPRERQSLFFSATVSPKIQEIIRAFVKDPIIISVKKEEIKGNIAQEIVRVENGQSKIDKLHDLLINDGFNKVLIFGRTKRNVEKLSKELIDRGFKAGSIHGNKRQSQREKVLRQFKHREIRILLATDVASRGLDIDGISHVINFDMPETYEDYIHRIGRTGRVGKKGIALTFVE